MNSSSEEIRRKSLPPPISRHSSGVQSDVRRPSMPNSVTQPKKNRRHKRVTFNADSRNSSQNSYFNSENEKSFGIILFRKFHNGQLEFLIKKEMLSFRGKAVPQYSFPSCIKDKKIGVVKSILNMLNESHGLPDDFQVTVSKDFKYENQSLILLLARVNDASTSNFSDMSGIEWIPWNHPHDIDKNVNRPLSIVFKYSTTNPSEWADLMDSRPGIHKTQPRRSSFNFMPNDWRTESGTGVVVPSPDSLYILIIEHELNSQHILQKWIGSIGYNIIICGSGIEGWNFLSKHAEQVDLIIYSTSIPDHQKFNLLEKLQSPLLESIFVLLISVPGNDIEPPKLRNLDLIYRPLSESVILKKIETCFELQTQKRNEYTYRRLLHQERKAKEKFFSQVEEKEKKIDELSKQVNELEQIREQALQAIETPIQTVTRDIGKLLLDPMVRDSAIGTELKILLKAIGSTDLYRPRFEKMLENEIDPLTRTWLLSEFSTEIFRRRSSVQTFPELINDDTKDQIKDWDFHCFDYAESSLVTFLVEMFKHFELLERYQIEERVLETFLLTVRKHYNKTPYHNFYHAFDVAQTVFSVLVSFNAAIYLTHLDIFALLVSSICHDIEHPGQNNAYLVTTMDNLALHYNDQSVLENHHCATTFKLARMSHQNIFANLPTSDFFELRKIIIDCILITDMSHHFSFLAKFQQRLENGVPFDREKKEDRILLMQFLLKAADISNVCKPWEVSKLWAERVSEEFFRQGDLEKTKGLVPAPHMDRSKSTPAKTTANFIDFIARPLFECLVKLLPAASICLEHCNSNREKLAEAIKREEINKASSEENKNEEKKN